MAILGPDGKPVQAAQAENPEAIIDVIIMTPKVENLVKSTIKVQTKQGGLPEDVEASKLVQDLVQKLCLVMQNSKEKEMIIRIADNSSELVMDKQIKLGFMDLVAPQLNSEGGPVQEAPATPEMEPTMGVVDKEDQTPASE